MYDLSIPIVGLTGGIATGKSTVSEILKQQGVALIDADALVKDIYALNETKKLVKKLAPEAITDETIDFKKLRKAFFENEEIKKGLESHIYLRLPEVFLKRLKSFDTPRFVVYDVPLLFEKGLESKMDLTALVYAPRELQVKRLMERDQIDLPLANKILCNQMDIEDKQKLADMVIHNDKDFSNLEAEVMLFLKESVQHI